MKFACDSCQTKYTIPDEKVRGKVLKIRCKKCGAVITVKEEASAPVEPEAPPMEERTRVADIGLLEKLRQAEENRQSPAAPAPAPGRDPSPPPPEWFVMINGEQVGPLSPDDLSAKVHGNEITDRSHVWRDGMGDWKRAGEIDELADLFPPPAPPAPPPRAAPPPRPVAAAAAPLPAANYDDDDNVPTIARQMPDLKALFGEGEAKNEAKNTARNAPKATEAAASRPEMVFDDAPPPSRTNGLANGHNAPAPSNNLADLMGDLGEDSGEHTGAGPLNVGGDPFAAVPDSPQLAKPTIGEQTRFFMKKAGVTNRNPWWKYAIFVVLVLGVPVVALYSLGKAGVGGTVTVIDAVTGEEKQVPKFSLDNVAQNGLAALLAGKSNGPGVEVPKKAIPAAVRKADPKPLVDPHAGDPKANLSDADKKKIADNMAKNPNSGLIGDDPKSNPGSGPVDHSHDKTGPDVDKASDGLSTEVVAKVVADNSGSFNKCVEDKLKRDPSWKGGKVNLSVKIGPSGTVLDSSIDKDDVSHSDVGDCIKSRVKRMHFPRFSGDEPQEVQFPLVLTNGG